MESASVWKRFLHFRNSVYGSWEASAASAAPKRTSRIALLLKGACVPKQAVLLLLQKLKVARSSSGIQSFAINTIFVGNPGFSMFMKYLLFTVLACMSIAAFAQNQYIITEDLDRYWQAYDKIKATTDTSQHLEILQSEYVDKGTPGLKLLMRARRYTTREMVDNIRAFPKFWNSIRPNTLKAAGMAKEIETGVLQLKAIYPELLPQKMYFAMGGFRTGGTYMERTVLIGAEIAMADSSINTSEFPERLNHLPEYYKTNPIRNIVPLNVHEYVHTQQKAEYGYDLLSQCILEGVAEFVAEVATGKPSVTPAVAFGKKNDFWVRKVFSKEMFSPWSYRWLYNDKENEFKMRDMGYYVGYAIVSKYYQKSKDKKAAIKEIIELDLTSKEAIENFVQRTWYFSSPIRKLRKAYEKQRPRVVRIRELPTKTTLLPAGQVILTAEVNQPINTYFRSTDFGPLGKDYFPEIVDVKIAADGRSIQYTIKVVAGRKYQMMVQEGFRTDKAIPLVPYLIEFSTRP